MRVAMITHFPEDLERPAGGPAVGSIALLRGLSKYRELDLHVITDWVRRRDTYELQDPRCVVHPVPRSRWLPGFVASATVDKWRVAALLEEMKPDVVHAQGHACWVDPHRWPAVLTIRGIPEIDTLYSERPFRRFRAWFIAQTEGRSRWRFSDIICISHYVGGMLEGRFAGRLHHIPNCIDDAFFSLARTAEPARVLFVGSIIPLKNIDGLLEAARIVADTLPDVTFRLAGPARTEEYLASRRRRAEEIGLGDRVTFLGLLSRDDLCRELAAASCLVLPSFQENLPMAVAEALAAGVPVVASGVGGVPEMIEEGGTGFLVDAHRPDEIADRVLRILRDPALADRLSRQARRRAEVYRIARVAAQTVEVYRQVHDAWRQGR